MTVQTCTNYCAHVQSYAIKFAGLEYGRECWCSVDVNTNSQKLDDSACASGCAGNDTERCGGNLVLSVYMLSSTSGAGQRWVAGGAWTMLGLMIGVVGGATWGW